MRRFPYIIICALLTALTGCRNGNDMVLGLEEMASLMADLHMAEAAVDLNYSRFPNDSTRLELRQSVYAAHGVTPEQVDSSIGWYGHHLEDYMKVYDRTVEILKDRQKELLASANEHIVLEGDSVNIWPLSTHFEFASGSPSRLLTFNIEADSTWHDRDVFLLKYHLMSAKEPLATRLTVIYKDNSVEYSTGFSRDKGKADCAIRIDSADIPLRIVGTIMAAPKEGETVRIDSVSFVRMRSSLYNGYVPGRRFRYNIKKKTAQTDTIPADTTATLPATPGTLPAAPGTLPGNTGTLPGNTPAAHPGAAHRPASPAATRPTGSGHRNAAPPSVAPRSGTGESAAQQAKRQRDALLNNSRKK